VTSPQSNQQITDTATVWDAFLACNKQFALRFAIKTQADAHEFLTLFLETLGADIGSYDDHIGVAPVTTEMSNAEASKVWWTYSVKQHQSPIMVHLGFQLKSTLRCNTCNNMSTTFALSQEIQLEVPTHHHSMMEKLIAEQSNVSEQLIEDERWYCCKCASKQITTKTTSLWSAPEVLIVLLKRFKFENGQRRKLSTEVTIPSTFDMKEHLDQDSNRTHIRTKYHLSAATIHSGSVHRGHYTAIVRNVHLGRTSLTAPWLVYDDAKPPQQITDEEFNSVQTRKGAYVLYYTRDEQGAGGGPAIPSSRTARIRRRSETGSNSDSNGSSGDLSTHNGQTVKRPRIPTTENTWLTDTVISPPAPRSTPTSLHSPTTNTPPSSQGSVCSFGLSAVVDAGRIASFVEGDLTSDKEPSDTSSGADDPDGDNASKSKDIVVNDAITEITTTKYTTTTTLHLNDDRHERQRHLRIIIHENNLFVQWINSKARYHSKEVIGGEIIRVGSIAKGTRGWNPHTIYDHIYNNRSYRNVYLEILQ
jgi:cytochrome c-type biogenesis protein CcmH/NrfF